MQPPSANVLLRAWESGRQRHPLDRALLLHSMAEPALDPDTLADLPLGRRNAELLRLRAALFGDALSGAVACPQCGERLEFSLSASALLEPSRAGDLHVEVDGVRFRLPTTRDLARIAEVTDEQTAAQQLLLSLAEPSQTANEQAVLPLAARVAGALSTADPCLEFGLEFACPACAHAWSTSFDVAAYVWEEIDVRSRRLLDEVHVLACAYHWSERAILELSEARRAAYLARVLA